jgi:hypothetical protein
MSWTDAKGNQGNYCSITKYPELDGGVYTRKTTLEGGIGKSCNTDNDCAVGYFCNNETDMFGKNVQQTGYCSQVYNCPDGSHHLGYPYNSGVPIVPPPGQNKGGMGYSSNSECSSNKLALQDCKQDKNGKWFATYPGYCPVVSNLRSGNSPSGMLPSSSLSAQNAGIKIPAYATNKSSSSGGSAAAAFVSNINSKGNGMTEALKYEMSINPR